MTEPIVSYPERVATLSLSRPKKPKEPSSGAERAAIVDELNREYAVILLGSGAAVLREGTDAFGSPEYRFLSLDAFKEWMRPFKLWTGEKPTPHATIWLNDPRRRQYDGIVFAPQQDAPGYYNLWRGFAVEPDPDASCNRFLDHVAENVCQGDERLFAWVMGWFAAIVQRPTEKSGTSLLLRGAQGTGKTIVGKMIGALLGEHYALVADPRFVTGRFNSHLVNRLLLQLDEATWGGDHVAAGKLKDLVTGEYQLIEYKGKEPIRVRNYLRLLITTNNEWAIPAGLEERRFAVLDVGERCLQDASYFQAIEDEMRAGGYGALLHYLLTYDLTDINVRQIPATAALHEQKIQSMNSEHMWWLDILMRGELPGDREGRGTTPVDELYAHYLAHAQKRGITRRSGETQLGMFLKHTLKDAAPPVSRRRLTVTASGTPPRRTYCYELPPLRVCRDAWDRTTRSTTDWPDVDATWSTAPAGSAL